MRHYVYLHGFASSPQSSKAIFFSERLAERGVTLQVPDLNAPEFHSLTISRMLRQLEALASPLPAGDLVLIGSSLGGFVAVEAAARFAGTPHPVSQLVLLAPAVELEWERWDEIGRVGIEQWHITGDLEVFHHANDRPERLSVAFYEDALSYQPARRRLEQPMLIFQGRFDESVSPASVERFAARQPGATLHLLDDGHQLRESLSYIWSAAAPVLL